MLYQASCFYKGFVLECDIVDNIDISKDTFLGVLHSSFIVFTVVCFYFVIIVVTLSSLFLFLVQVKRLDCIKALVAFNADINVFNRGSHTPLDVAKHGDCKDIAKLLEDVGGLTSKAIMDGYQEAEELGFKPEMSKAVMNMDKDVMEMTVSYGGAAGPFGGRDRDRVDKDMAKVNGGGVNPDALTSKLQDVKESGSEDTDIGYQRQREDGDESVYFSPAEERQMEERQMDSIPEGEKNIFLSGSS